MSERLRPFLPDEPYRSSPYLALREWCFPRRRRARAWRTATPASAPRTTARRPATTKTRINWSNEVRTEPTAGDVVSGGGEPGEGAGGGLGGVVPVGGGVAAGRVVALTAALGGDDQLAFHATIAKK